jgi:hypothetical protein
MKKICNHPWLLLPNSPFCSRKETSNSENNNNNINSNNMNENENSGNLKLSQSSFYTSLNTLGIGTEFSLKNAIEICPKLSFVIKLIFHICTEEKKKVIVFSSLKNLLFFF